MKKTVLLFGMMIALFTSTYAKIWRVNNNAGITADFATLAAAHASASVVNGDTLHIEPSATSYQAGATITKSLVYIGIGYFLDPANTTAPANTGLQVSTVTSDIGFLRLGAGSDGSKFIGITFDGSIYVNGVSNLTFEKDYFPSGLYFESGTNNNATVRKCIFINSNQINAHATNAVMTNFVCENNLFFNSAFVNLPILTGSGNIFRNNSASGFNGFTLANTYVANNIFGTTGVSAFTNCTIKNNLFQVNQTLPGSATNNQLNVNMANVYVGGNSSSYDSRFILKAGSPAIAAGLTIGSVVTPDCGAFGATDPYKLSGIPAIPSIYTLNVPVSIPSGSATMNVTFSTRNNN